MLSNNKIILDKSIKDNLESYLNNLQINNPKEKVNSDFLKKYLQKLEKQLETNESNLENSELKNKSSKNELESLRIKWKKNSQNKTEENNEELIKNKEKCNKRRKSAHRRTSGKIVVRESDVFMKGPWILDEENGDINFENEIENLEKEGIDDNPVLNEENENPILDLKMDHSPNVSKEQFNNLIGNEDEQINKEEKSIVKNIEKKEKSEIKEIKRKEENKTSEKIEKSKRVEVPRKHSTFFNIKKYLFGLFGSFNSNNNEEKEKESKENKQEENRGVLSSSSASSVSDNDNMDEESKLNNESSNIKETDKNENSQMVTINKGDDSLYPNKMKDSINVTLLDQLDNEEINAFENNEILFNNINKYNMSNRNRSHSFYITEKERFNYLLSIENQRKRKSDDRFIEIFNETSKNNRSSFKRSKTEIDKSDSSSNNKTKTLLDINIDNNKVENNDNNIRSNKFSYADKTVIHKNNSDDKSNFDNTKGNHNNPICNPYNMSESELKDSKFIRLLKEGKNEYLNTTSYIKNNLNSKVVQSNQKLSILPSDYDFSKIDENFDNLFDKSEEKIIPVNLNPFSSVFNESTIYPVSKNISKFSFDEGVLNSTMINNIPINVDNINNDKRDLINEDKNDKSMLIMDKKQNIEKTLIVDDNSKLNKPNEEYESFNIDEENDSLNDKHNSGLMETNEFDEGDSELYIYKKRKRKIKSIIVSDEEDEVSFVHTNNDLMDIDEKMKKRESEIFKRQKVYIIDNNLDDEEMNDDVDNYVDDYDESNDDVDINTDDEMNKINSHKDVIIDIKRKKRKVKRNSSDLNVQNFKKERIKITSILYKEFNKEIFDNQLPVDLEIEWSKTLYKTAGRTKMKRNKEKIKSAKIELSYKVLDDIEKLKNTLVHEMCHVAVFFIDNVEERKHGNHFKYWGRKAESCYSDIKVTTYHSYKIDYKYKYKCQNCGHIYGRHSKSIDVKKYRCQCSGEIKLMEKLKKDGTPYKKRMEGKFALYLKENYARIKKENQKLSHKDIMSLIVEEYNKINNKN